MKQVIWLKNKYVKIALGVLIAAVLIVLISLMIRVQTPDDYYGDKGETKANVIGKVTVSIRCDQVVGKSDSEHIPSDGVILAVTEVDIAQGETVYDILIEVAKKHGIQIENDGTDAMPYIVGIGNVYASDFGELSGWTYRKNGEYSMVGCGDDKLADGDSIEWTYVLDFMDIFS